ncbi:RAM signaling pathway protein-domain-containing protein [Plectosphaerella plurivora]|uniref:RAM signaling pathway protein-domain-containing protein n=1 Tax=Plectosphaerella plurivora TaxID=936078 RepID=A0A9P8VC51_9PEZI|nr:RAM signaling pathway protein-domain-containing protein [Plectosphaerella plurivora]
MDRMERPDRPSGPPGRGLPENPAQGVRRQYQNAPSFSSISSINSINSLNGVNVPPPPPVPSMRNAPSNANLSASAPMSSAQVIALARDAMQNALLDNEQQSAAVNSDLKPGVTIDLSRKGIQKLPEEVVDIIKNELERLALSHNQLASFPARFAECTSLRYLNVRNNQIREFPLALCDLRSLEILDLSKNKLRALPPEIVKLASLKVFSVQRNRIEELPYALADMVSLQVLKFDGNPISFPPREVLQVQASSPPNEGWLKESEVTEVTATAHIKRYLRQRILNGRAESESADESSETMETPRLPPMKRAASGRFPIKVNGTDIPDKRSPAAIRAPPIPNRSHYRGLSAQSTTSRRPGVMPLTISNVNERGRSNSETLLQATRGERPESRARRMGVVSQKASQLGTLDETQANNRFSHYRGLSHGSAMSGAPVNMALKSPNSPAESLSQRPVYVRRLSILPERRPESKVFDPVLEAAKGILYAVFQIHPMIQMLMSLTSDGSAKRSSLEMIFYNTNSHVEELEQEIQNHDPTVGGIDMSGYDSGYSDDHVRRACQTLVGAYIHICALLTNNIDTFIDNGDPRYIRTLLTSLYNSIMEIRATLLTMPPAGTAGSTFNGNTMSNTIKPRQRDTSNATTPTTDRAPMQRARGPQYLHNPGNLRVATDMPMSYVNGLSGNRTPLIGSATPRSGESFSSTVSSNRGMPAEFTEDDRSFEKIFLILQRSSDLVLRTLPMFQSQLSHGAKIAQSQRAMEEDILCWRRLIDGCSRTLQQSEALKNRLSQVKLKEPGIMSQANFRNLITSFLHAWADFADEIRHANAKVPLPPDTKARLRPIHLATKEAMDTILQSPWNSVLPQSQQGSSMFSPNGSVSSYAPMHMQMQHLQMPMTPQSAALGPAVQATVPSTPQSASFAAAFSGNVFERADALINMGGMAMSSRNHSMASHGSSFSSIGSLPPDGFMTPASSVMSGSGFAPNYHAHNRMNGSKVAF